MTGIIRSPRLATESKTLPVPPASIPIPIQPAATVQIDAGARHPSPHPEAVSYEHYKQRFQGELAELRRQAIEGGREEGVRQGREAAEAEYRRQLESLRQVIGAAKDARDRYVEDIADEAAEIVLTAVAKILGDGFRDHSAAVAAVAEAIRRSKARGKLLVRVSPADHAMLESCRGELLEGAGTQEIEIVADEQVRLGGCILDTNTSGSLDARLDVQLQRLREALLQARASWGSTT